MPAENFAPRADRCVRASGRGRRVVEQRVLVQAAALVAGTPSTARRASPAAMGGPRGVIRPEVHFPRARPRPMPLATPATGPPRVPFCAARRRATHPPPRPARVPPPRPNPRHFPHPAKKRKKDKRAERVDGAPIAPGGDALRVARAPTWTPRGDAVSGVPGRGALPLRVAGRSKSPRRSSGSTTRTSARSVKKHLARLGFESVYNEDEDFYAVAASGGDHDVVLAIPVQRRPLPKDSAFRRESGKPWLLLLPNFVCRKQYYEPAINPPPSGGIEDGGAPRSSPRQLLCFSSRILGVSVWAPRGVRGAGRGEGHDAVRDPGTCTWAASRTTTSARVVAQEVRAAQHVPPPGADGGAAAQQRRRSAQAEGEENQKRSAPSGGRRRRGRERGGGSTTTRSARRGTKKRREEEGRGGGSAGGAGGRGKGKKRGRQREEGDKGKKKKKKKKALG